VGTKYRGTPAEVRALDAYIKVMRAAGTLKARMERRLHEYGLSETQFGVLEILLHLGPLPPSELSRKQFSSCANITLVVDNLERDGLVKREPSKTDRRSTTVSITPAGRERVRAALASEVAEVTRELGELTASEQRVIGELAKKLGLAVQALPEREAAGGPRPRRRRVGAT